MTTVPPDDLLARAEAALRAGDPHRARLLLAQLVAAPAQRGGGGRGGDQGARRRALDLLGAACFELGDLDAAEEAFTAARDLATRADDLLLFARASNNLGTIATLRGRHEVALGLYRLVLPALQRAGYVAGLAETHHNLAITYRDLGQLNEADEAELKAVEFAAEANAPRVRAMARVGRAELRLARGDPAMAEAWSGFAAEECAAIGDPVGEADALRLVAAARLQGGAAQGAWSPADRAVGLAHRHGSARIEAEALEVRARLHARLGRPEAARSDVEQALALAESLREDRLRRRLREWLAVELGPAR